jgi:signal peptidase I
VSNSTAPAYVIKSFASLVCALAFACNNEQRAILTGDLRAYRIPTTAMEPTIHKDEYVLARALPAPAEPQRADIVVFQYPLDPKIIFAKRVVGLPGDTVECHEKQIWVNGARITEPYAMHDDPQTFNDHTLPEPYRSRDNFGPIHLAPHEYFMLGDNRDSSSDSRYWGPVPRKLIMAKAVKVGSSAGPFRPLS